MRRTVTFSPGPSSPWPALVPVGLFVAIATILIVGRTPPPMMWLAPMCFGAFASLILVWRSGAPAFAQSGLSMLVITEPEPAVAIEHEDHDIDLEVQVRFHPRQRIEVHQVVHDSVQFVGTPCRA